MRLFSTILDINETLTPDKFVELLVEWNQNSPYPENIINGFKYTNERTFKCGSDNVYIDVIENTEKKLMAAKHVKRRKDGSVWTTEYVVNFNQLKISILSDRSYNEAVLKDNPDPIAPNFITYLINGGFLKDDAGLSVLHTPIYINLDNIGVIADVINGKSVYSLPIVYVSKKLSDGMDPVDISKLSAWLRGVAHILVEENKDVGSKLRRLCKDKNAHNGAIDVYFPNSSANSKRFYGKDEKSLGIKLARNIINFANQQEIPDLYTWEGVKSSQIFEDLQNSIQELEVHEALLGDQDKTVADMSEKIEELKMQISELNDKNRNLQSMNDWLKSALEDKDSRPLIYYGDEVEFIYGEIKETVMEGLEELLALYENKRKRRYDILQNVIESNSDYDIPLIEKQKIITSLFKGKPNLDDTIKSNLKKMEIDISDEGKHYKLKYHGEDAYSVTTSKTTNNKKSKNVWESIIQDINKTMF